MCAALTFALFALLGGFIILWFWLNRALFRRTWRWWQPRDVERIAFRDRVRRYGPILVALAVLVVLVIAVGSIANCG